MIISDARHYKTHEDAIANVVLWFALIMHVGKQRNGLKGDTTECCVMGPNVSPCLT